MTKSYKYSAKIVAANVFLRFYEKFQKHYWLSDGMINLYRVATGTSPIAASLKMMRREEGSDLRKLFKPFVKIGKDRTINHFWVIYYENASEEMKRSLRNHAIQYLDKRKASFKRKNTNTLNRRFNKVKRQNGFSEVEINFIKGIYYAHNFDALTEYYDYLKTEKYIVTDILSIFSGLSTRSIDSLISGRLFNDGVIK